MAALRALTMHATIHATCVQLNGADAPRQQRAVSANGSANTEWLKRTNER